MAPSPKSVPDDALSRSVLNLSISDEIGESSSDQRSQSQETTGFSNSNPSAIPLYPQRIWASIPSKKDPIFTGFKKEIPPDPLSSSTNPGPKQQDEEYAFFTLAGTSEGSRTLQKIIMAGNPSVTTRVLRIVTSRVSGTPLLYFLMIDPFGCHVCSKLIDVCNTMQLGLLIENLIRDDEILINVSTNSQGANLLKKLIKLLRGTPYSSFIVLKLSGLFNLLMTNQTASYVVTFCLDWLGIDEVIPLYEQAISQGLSLASHTVGCVSLNYVIDKIQGFHRQQLLGLVAKNSVFLSQDPSGNYVLQKVIALENPVFNDVIGSMLRGHYAKLSMQKWGSHVVEKCLNSPAAMEYVAEDFVNCGSNQLVQIAKDQFGNYVIQTALDVTKKWNNSVFRKLVQSLKQQLNVLQFGYGKNIYKVVVSEFYCNSIV